MRRRGRWEAPRYGRREACAQTGAAGAAALIGSPLLQPGPASAQTGVPDPAAELPVKLRVNGTAHTLALDPRVTLLDALREHLGLTGSKKGCHHGQCGACTVLVNGRRIKACLSLAVMHEGDEITTIQGLAHGEELHPVQAAFLEHDGFQCGYCTPGQICSVVACITDEHARSGSARST